jgi:large subunit ribosomal protein L29
MRASELRELGRDELVRKLAGLKDELLKLRLRRTAEPLPNPLRLRTLRREIARTMTVLGGLDKQKGTAK